jgi:hypothetical protein
MRLPAPPPRRARKRNDTLWLVRDQRPDGINPRHQGDLTACRLAPYQAGRMALSADGNLRRAGQSKLKTVGNVTRREFRAHSALFRILLDASREPAL